MVVIILRILVDTLYLLALINPVSKISVLSALSSTAGPKEFGEVTGKSSVAAAAILLVSMSFGHFVLSSIFQVELHSLRLAGGVVLFWVGFTALRKGVFFEMESSMRFQDVAVVPLACPLIAGPATITAVIALGAQHGMWTTAAAILVALTVNDLIMRLTSPLERLLRRFNILGAVIRITGLIVMTIGTEMALDGLAAWGGRSGASDVPATVR
ncbi:MAG: MarC family protein [Planctomycetes bacterium]|nr:MarC family protein [Planctomycetota bacterium]